MASGRELPVRVQEFSPVLPVPRMPPAACLNKFFPAWQWGDGAPRWAVCARPDVAQRKVVEPSGVPVRWGLGMAGGTALCVRHMPPSP